MAAASGRGSHGSKLRNSGSKRTISDLKQYKREWCKTERIFLENNIFQSWLGVKLQAGYKGSSDSDFAAHLLSLEYQRR